MDAEIEKILATAVGIDLKDLVASLAGRFGIAIGPELLAIIVGWLLKNRVSPPWSYLAEGLLFGGVAQLLKPWLSRLMGMVSAPTTAPSPAPATESPLQAALAYARG
jgi:hypothetical protein